MHEIKTKIEGLRRKFDEDGFNAKTLEDLQELRNLYLSRSKGYIQELFDDLKALSPDEKPEAGKNLNQLKAHINRSLRNLHQKLSIPPAPGSVVDLTLPGKRTYWGAPHPLRIFREDIECIFLRMGFSIGDGPEIENDYYNFEALNFPPLHPSRDTWGAFHITDDLLLRTHTSPVHIRIMEKKRPPIRIITPGRVFRKETPDSTHTPAFFQLEGLVVDHGITFAHLKGTMEYFLKALFHEKSHCRLRPGFAPFTEPSVVFDLLCPSCGGEQSDCRFCRGGGWVDILAAGMVDPQVFKNVSIDPEKYSGFAFGLNVDRIAMVTYGVQDARIFYENDLRFLRQFLSK